MTEKITGTIKYITHDIWIKKEEDYKSPRVRSWVRRAKIVLYIIMGVGKHNVPTRAAALTFYTVMSVVPIVALLFGVTKGFGLDEKLNDYLYTELAGYEPLIDRIVEFANVMLQRTRGGIIATVGVLILFWSVVKVFANVEGAFNTIWEVRKGRNLPRKVTDYISVLVIAPLLLVASNSIILQLQTQLVNIDLSFVGEILASVLSLIFIWLLFTYIYKVMPNTKVGFKSAFWAGMIAGTAFYLFQMVYFWIQSGVANVNAIYGSFAAIPLFLIWLQASWTIVLLGSELSFAYQNIKNFEYEKISENISYDFRRKIIVVVMQEVVKHFVKNDGPVTSVTIADELNLPIRMVRDAIYELLKAKLIAAVNNEDDRTHYYVPAHDVQRITISGVIRAVEGVGEDVSVLEANIELKPIENVIEKFDKMISGSDSDKLLVDLESPIPKKKRAPVKRMVRKKKEKPAEA